MDLDESPSTTISANSNNCDNVKDQTTTNNEQREQSTVRRKTSLTRKRRNTQSNGDGSNFSSTSSTSSTKQTITTAINQILHRRASVSSQRPKDIIAEISTYRLDTTDTTDTNNTRNTTPPSPISVNAPIQQPSQNQPSHSQPTHQQQPLQRLLRKKSLRAFTGGQYSTISSSQSSPLSQTVEEDPLYNDYVNNNNLNSSANVSDSNNNFNNSNNNSNLINKRVVLHHGIASTYSFPNSPTNSTASQISPRKQFPFEIGSREQKLLSSSTKDDRMEKLLKKAKIFLDQKQRPKARIASLWSIIDVANELDQAQFFRQNAEDVFDVVCKSFMGQVDKIKQKPDRPTSFTSKEFLNLNKTLLLFRKILLFLPDRIRGGWQRKQTAEILSVLLDHGNHPRVRIQGFQLLLLWLNDQTMELDECIHLYSNAISLNLFLNDQMRNINEEVYHTKDNLQRKSYIPLILYQELIRGDLRGPLFPNPHPPIFSDAINLIHIDLGNIVRLAHVAAGSTPPSENYEFPAIESIEPDNGIAIGMGIDAAFAAAKFHFELIKKQYLVKLFPQCAKQLGLLPKDQEYGFQKCPPTILRALITFFIHHCLDNYNASETISSYPSPATPILKSIVLGPENREFAHEIVRQSLMLPAGSSLNKDIVRGAVHIVGVWILSEEEERPAFLRKSLPFSPSSISQSDASTTPTSSSTPVSAKSFTCTYSDANVYLRRYIELLNLVFEDYSLLTIDGGMTNIEVEAQVSIYRDVLSLYRSMMAGCSIELEPETWKTLLWSLLDIQKKIMNQSEKYAPISSVALADDFADYLVETLLYAFARSEVRDQDLWNELSIQVGSSTRWSQTISQWTRLMLRLTKILSKHVYQVDLDQLELQRRLLELSTSERHHHRRKPSKSHTKHLSLKHKSSSSTSSREDFEFSSPGLSKNTNEHGKFGRRTLSMHSDMSQLGIGGQNLLSNGSASSSMHYGVSDEDYNEEDENDDFFDACSDINEDADVKSNRTSTFQPNFSNEKLSISLANFKSPDFVNLNVLPWTAESSLLVWRNMLYALGNLNYIQIIPYHADAIKCLVDMLDMLGLVCNNQFGNVPLPPIYEFTPLFLEACDLPLAFARGRELAYGGLCKMMSYRQSHEFDESYPTFCRTLLKGLSDSDRSIVHAIINNSTKLFSQGFPEIDTLYHSFIESIRNLLSEHDSKRIPEYTRQNAITILCSLICFSLSDKMRCPEIILVLKDTLISSLPLEDSIKNHDMHNMLLYGIFTLAFDELTATTLPDKTIIKECIQVLLDQLYWSHLPIVSAAADCLITFAQNSSMWFNNKEIYVMILQDVFANLIGALDEHITVQKATMRNGRGFIIAKLFYCLLEWLMVIPSFIFTDTDLCQLVFDVIDLAFEDCGAESLNYYKKVYPTPLKNQGKETSLKFKKSARKIALEINLGSKTYVPVSGIENDTENENFVKEVAECVLLHLTHHFDNFAPLYGPAMINSTLIGPLGNDTKDDECSEHYQYFSFKDRTIITVVEIPEEEISRLIIRDMTGRYTWDTSLFYKEPYSKQSSDPKHSDIIKCMTLRPDIKVEPTSSNLKLSYSARSRSRNRLSNFYDDNNRLPIWTKNSNNEQVDMLDHLLYCINDHTSEALDSPRASINSFKNELLQFEKELDRHIQEEILYVNSTDSQASSWYENIMSLRDSVTDNKSDGNRISKRLSRSPLYSRSTSHLSLGADFSLSKAFLPVIPPEAEKPQGPYQQCRLFLSHFGWLNPDTFKDESICILNKDPALYRDIRLLDKKCSRECIKVALLYVKSGQEDEQSILHNMNGSKEYDEFVTSLGWEVDLSTHPGYLGGLERNSTNGTTSIYYCTSTLEVIFHDVTRMPTDPTDPKQLRKKRHIGNDHVHIIWNEHHRDYRKSTIGGDFGNAQIVISPLSDTNLYRIDIYRDNKVSPFGPLLNGMVISKNVLGPLVRMTAIHAFRASINNSNNNTIYQHPYLQRSLDINTMIGKYKKNSKNNSSYERFISKIFFTDDSSL